VNAQRTPVAGVLAQGDMRASLVALRNRLAEQIDAAEGRCSECSAADGRVLATLTKELREVLRAIDELPQVEGASRIDELANARKARQAGARRRDPAGAAQRSAVPD